MHVHPQSGARSKWKQVLVANASLSRRIKLSDKCVESTKTCNRVHQWTPIPALHGQEVVPFHEWQPRQNVQGANLGCSDPSELHAHMLGHEIWV